MTEFVWIENPPLDKALTMESSHYLIFMMKTDGCRRSKENCIPRDRQQRKSSEVIPMMRMEKSKRSRITGIDMQKRMEEVAKFE